MEKNIPIFIHDGRFLTDSRPTKMIEQSITDSARNKGLCSTSQIRQYMHDNANQIRSDELNRISRSIDFIPNVACSQYFYNQHKC